MAGGAGAGEDRVWGDMAGEAGVVGAIPESSSVSSTCISLTGKVVLFIRVWMLTTLMGPLVSSGGSCGEAGRAMAGDEDLSKDDVLGTYIKFCTYWTMSY